MAFTTGFTPQQLAQLEKTIALAAKSIEHGGKKTEFQKLQDMLDLRDRMKSELAAASTPAPTTPPFMTRPTIFVR